MNKDDKSDSLFSNLISGLRKDIELLNASKSYRKLVLQMSEKLNMLEKIIAVSVINNEREINNQPLPPEAPPGPRPIPDRLITPEELAYNDGKDGRPAFVAFEGIVYDVSGSPRWNMGIHFGVPAGRDNTTEYRACHGGRPRLEDIMPIVGRLDV